jgi:DNA-binding LacI/PurR family transcriptional regulator
MRSGEFPPGAVLPPWRAMAQHYRVGVRVIQHAVEALKRDGLVAATPQRRLVARDWDSPGTALETKVLVLMSTSPRLWLGPHGNDELLLGITLGVGQLTSPMLLAYDDRLRNHVPAELLESPIRGVVLVGKHSAAVLRAWERVQVPVVLADRPGGALKLHAASIDNAGATSEIVERLRALGHRRIAFVRRMHTDGVYDVDPDSRERQTAFAAAMEKITTRTDAVYSIFSKDTADAAGLKSLFARKPRFTAVLTVDQTCAGLVLEAASRRGLTVPHDLSIAIYAPLEPGDVKFSGLRFDFRELGRNAARLAGMPRVPPQRFKLPGKWMPGSTIAPAPKTRRGAD